MYNYFCKKCSVSFETRKKNQTFCSKSCANSYNTSKRKVEEKSIFECGINKINSYILGVIYSDGCLSYDRHTSRFRITISMNDLMIIEFLRNNYAPTKKIYTYKHPKGKSETYSFISTNPFDVNFLMNLGITERKSLVVSMPELDENNIRHFIRGVFDGDGSVYINKTSTNYNGIRKYYEYVNASFTTGSIVFAQQIKNILEMNNIECTIVKDSRSEINNSYYVKIYSKNSIANLYSYIYHDAHLYLDRKRSIFKKMI